MRAGATPWLLIDYTNLTAIPSTEGQADAVDKSHPKLDFMINSTAHINFSGETHVRAGAERRLIKCLMSSRRWWIASAEAQASDDSEDGSYGGVLMQARS